MKQLLMPGLEVDARKLAKCVHVSKTFVESSSNARRNARTKPEAIKIADCSEKSSFFSHSRLQSSYSLVQWQKDLTIDLGYKVVEGRNELVEEKKIGGISTQSCNG